MVKLKKDNLVGKTITFKKRVGDFDKGDKAKVLAKKGESYILADRFAQYSILKSTLKNNI